MKLLLKDCRLIPQLSGGFSSEHAAVLAEGGKIVKVFEAADTKASEDQGTEVIDCKGKTLLPGLMDIHTHLSYDYYKGAIRLNDFKLLVNASLNAKRFLDYGVTTIRDMGAPKGLSVYVRDAIKRGLFQGPRVISGGAILRPRCQRADADPSCFLRYFSGADDLVSKVREEAGEGADFIKLYAPGEPPEILKEEMQAAVRAAHNLGKKVAVHAHDKSAIHMCIECGVDTIEHATHISEEDIAALKERSDIHLVPTLGILDPKVPVPGSPMELKEKMFMPFLKANGENITKAYKAGLVMGFGTDMDVKDYEANTGVEFKLRKEYCGMDNIDMLLQATKYSALICGLENVTGEIREGLDADLILVNGKPDVDIKVMLNKPEKVWVKGAEYISGN